MVFDDTNLKLTLISEDVKSYYTVRQLELENLAVSIDESSGDGDSFLLILGLGANFNCGVLRNSEPCAQYGFILW